MPSNLASSDATLAVFLDLENLVLGVRDAKYADFDIRKVLEQLLLKGHIVVKKAYCDFERYRDFKRGLHEAAFEMLEIPHVRQSGKNSADIRMVVDALDLCYMKGHVDTFAIISGDSDFSPLVSKLRENGKTVIGVGVKNSTSDLFKDNCDEFIYYDDLVRPQPNSRRKAATSTAAKSSPPSSAAKPPLPGPTPTVDSSGKSSIPSPTAKPAGNAAPLAAEPREGGDTPAALSVEKALDEVMETLEAISRTRGDDLIWSTMIKSAIKRRNPGFNERAYGFRSFLDLLLEAQNRGLLVLSADGKQGNHTVHLPD